MHRIPTHTNGAWSFPIPWRSVCFSHSLLVLSLDARFLWQTGHATLVATILLEKIIPTWEPFPTPRGPGVLFTGQVLRQLCAVPTVFRRSHRVDHPPFSELLKPTSATVKTQVAQPAEAPRRLGRRAAIGPTEPQIPSLENSHTLALQGRHRTSQCPWPLPPTPSGEEETRLSAAEAQLLPLQTAIFSLCAPETTTLSIISCKLETLFTGKDTRKDSLQPLWKGPYQEP